MSEQAYHHYIVKGGEALDAVNRYMAKENEFSAFVSEVIDEFGADAVTTQYNEIRGLVFPNPLKHPGKPWRSPRKSIFENEWVPDKTTRDGKALARRLTSVTHPRGDELAKLLGGGTVYCLPMVYYPTYEKIGDEIILKLPISSNPVNQFVPPDDVQQIKQSEYWQLKEEAEKV